MFSTRRITTMGGDVFRDEFSVDFTGDDEYILTDFKPNYIHTNATFAMWVKITNFAGSQLMGSHSNKRWYFGFSSLKAFIGVANNNINNITITPTPVAGQWLHYAVTAVDGTATVYINGVAQSTTLSYTQNSGHNPVDGFAIAIRRTSTNADGADTIVANPIKGKISEVVQYSKGLSASEVKTLYNGREPYNHKEGVCSSNLQAWWRMGDGVNDIPNSDSEGGIIGDEVTPTLGPNLWDAAASTFESTSTYNWTGYTDSTISNDSNTLKIVKDDTADNTDGAYIHLRDSKDLSTDLTVGKVYKLTFDAKVDTGNSVNVLLSEGGSTDNVDIIITNTSFQTYTLYFLCGNATGAYFKALAMATGEIIWFDNLKLQEVGGNAGVMQNMAISDFEGDAP